MRSSPGLAEPFDLDSVTQGLRQNLGLGGGRAGQDDDKFITPVASDLVVFVAAFPQALRDALEDLIPGGMAVSVIEQLEVVYIHHDDGQRLVQTLRLLKLFVETLMDGAMVKEPRHRIPVRGVHRHAVLLRVL